MSEYENQWHDVFELINSPRKQINKRMEEKEFTWTDDLVLEFARFTNHSAPTYQGRYTDLEQFKKSKQQKQYPEGIVSFKNIQTNHGGTITLSENKDYNEFVTWNLKVGNPIYSVQNGNEVLTVGDKIGTWVFRNQRSVFKIDRFEISEDNRIRLISLPDTIIYVPTEEIRKLSPLFQISGKDVYEGNTVYKVDKKTFYISQYIHHSGGSFSWLKRGMTGEEQEYENFLTMEDAENFVEDNRPQYSKAQLSEAFEQSRLSHSLVGWKHDNFEDYLKWLSLPENKTQTK